MNTVNLVGENTYKFLCYLPEIYIFTSIYKHIIIILDVIKTSVKASSVCQVCLSTTPESHRMV